MRGLFLWLLLASLPASAQYWSLQDPSKGWNSKDLVTLYFHNSQMQTNLALDALSHYTFEGNERVLDIGSGDGKLTAILAFLVPHGRVLGVDISQEMVYFARKMFPSTTFTNLDFLHVDNVSVQGLKNKKAFNLVTAFCVFHLIPDPKAVLENIKLLMHDEGRLVVTSPIGRNPEFTKAATEEMAKRGLHFPTPTEGTLTIRNPEKIRALLEELGFHLDHFEVVETRNPFSSKEELIDWLQGSCTANWNIPFDQSREFFTDLTNTYLKSRPQDVDEDGFVYFTLSMLQFVARLR